MQSHTLQRRQPKNQTRLYDFKYKDDPTRDLNHGRDSPQIYQSQTREATCEKFEKNNNDGKACTNQMKTRSCDINKDIPVQVIINA